MSSGVEGRVSIGPSLPETRDGTPGPGKPFQATIVVRDSTTEEQVAVVESTADGQFSVALGPGEYILEPTSPRPLVPPYAQPQRVTVMQGEITTATIAFDSGIR